MSKTKAAELYGPNTVAVQAIIERAGKLTHDEVLALHAAWTAALDAAWTAARTAAGDAAWTAARTAAGDAAWTAAWDAALDAARAAALNAARAAALDAAWTAAGAAADAAVAAVVRDLITPEQYAVLVGPWESVIKPEPVESEKPGELVPFTLSLPAYVWDSLETMAAQQCREVNDIVQIAVLSYLINDYAMERKS